MSNLFGRQRLAVKATCRLWLVFLVTGVIARAQISPGELSNAHSSLDRPGHCTDCHDAGKRPPEFKCLSCHRDIGERLKSHSGLHPSLVGADRTQRSCAQCHVEHNGKSFNLIHWSVPIEKFDHQRTGYRLEGRHATVACRNCHQPSHIPTANAASISVKNKFRTYLGLSPKCVECHADIHQGQLSMECERCHDPQNWKRPTRFDHSRTRFSLEAAHENVPCARCHLSSDSSKTVAKYTNLSFEDCSPCHRDPHAGSFKNSCRSCHSSQKTNWMSANESKVFDHSRARFSLLGKHAVVECKACHVRGNFNAPVAFAKCADCHKSDPHRGQFTSTPPAHDCDYCHTVSGFKPSTFGVAQHNTTRFPLKERHIETSCAKCHAANASGEVIYRIQAFACIECHKDVHGSQFAGEPYSNRCDSCHTEKEFKPSTFTTAGHDATRFPLAGAHVKAACIKCHKLDRKPVQFRFEDRSCIVCHEDPHQGEFTDRATVLISNKSASGCQACHTVNSWHELQKLDHSVTGFPLDGAHRTTSCDKCHKPVEVAAGKSILFDKAPKLCDGCHEDPHEKQFASRMTIILKDGNPAGCASCHDAVSWHELPGFNHSATAFPLQGAHQPVACDKCHKSETPQAGVKGINYVKAPTQCFSCHEDIHDGQFSSDSRPTDCTRCHQTQRWKPSEFNHDTQSSFKLTGAHRRVACGSCHSNTREAAGKKIIVYKGAPRDCSACHRPETEGRDE